MAWTLGAFTFSTMAGSQPIADDSEIRADAGEMVWSKQNPVGYSGSIMTYISTKAAEHKLKVIVVVADKNSLKAIADAHAPVLFTWPRNAVGKTVVVEQFKAIEHKDLSTKWTCEMTLVEQ